LFFLEDDLISFSVACSGSLPTEDADIALLEAPSGASFEPLTRTFTWPTTGSDGGRFDLNFSVQPIGNTGVPIVETVPVWVADNPSAAAPVPVDATRYTEEWGLPVMHIESDGFSQSYTPINVVFYEKSYEAFGKIRGATSAYYPKPSFTLEFDKDEIEIPAWDSDDRDHLILLTTFDDNSYVRQKLVYDQWAAMAEYWGQTRLTPRTFFTVVYINNSYWGLYVGLDRIDNEYIRQMGFENNDGNLYKAVDHSANFSLYNASGGLKSSLAEGYTKEEGEPESDFSDLEALVDFTGNTGPNSLVEGLADWVYPEEFMDWYWLVTYSLAEDSGGKNSYLYHDPDSGLFRFSPWDFNHSWGQNWYTIRVSAEDDEDMTWANRVFWAFLSNEDAQETLWSRLESMQNDGPFQPAWMTAQLDAYYALIDRSAARDWAEWSTSYYSYSSWSGSRTSANDWQDFEGEKAYLYSWLDQRALYFGARP